MREAVETTIGAFIPVEREQTFKLYAAFACKD
jgi:hypothetical protein